MTTQVLVTREHVIQAFQLLPLGTSISTKCLTRRIQQQFNEQASERRVRAAISWLVLGGLLEEAGTYPRRDSGKRKYLVKHYRWTGEIKIEPVTQKPQSHPSPRIAVAAHAINSFLYPQHAAR